MSGPPAEHPRSRALLVPSLARALWYWTVLAGIGAAGYHAGAVAVVDERRAAIAAAVLAFTVWFLAYQRVSTAAHRSAALFNRAREYQDLAIYGASAYEPLPSTSPTSSGEGSGVAPRRDATKAP